VDTGGLLRAIAHDPDGNASFPEYEDALVTASAVVVPSLILPEVDYFLRSERRVMRKLVAEIFDPATRYEFEPVSPLDIVRSLELDAKFKVLGLGLVDGAVAAVAERRGIHRVLTTDRRDFSILRLGPRFTRPLALLP
jgi:predicted nucleic acid-binding protein